MAHLPPKAPNMAQQNWPPAFQSHHRMPTLTNTTTSTSTTTNNTNNNNTTTPQQQQPSWVDEFLDFTTTRRGNHRRSMSDSVTFLEAPFLADIHHPHDYTRTNNNNNNNNSHPSSILVHGSGPGSAPGSAVFDRLDDDQLMSMFSDDISGTAAAGCGGGGGGENNNNNNNAASPSSDQNSNNSNNHNNGEMVGGGGMSCGRIKDLQMPPLPSAPKSEPGEGDSSADEQLQQQENGFIDPKRVKRILANRQSAQRSRVRKLQYISELERSVTSLQTEVSALSPRVAFLDHQRLILNVDNSALKQRIAALAQDKIFKDAHQEALRKEIERLRQVYHQQSMKNSTDSAAMDHNMEKKEQLMA